MPDVFDQALGPNPTGKAPVPKANVFDEAAKAPDVFDQAVTHQATAPVLVSKDPAQDLLVKKGGKALPPVSQAPTAPLKDKETITDGPGKQETPDYDMAGYEAKYGKPDQSKGQHLTDEFKLPNHITFSSDSKYSSDEKQGGKWSKDDKGTWHFSPSDFNLKQHSREELVNYFKRAEPDSILDLPEEKSLGHGPAKPPAKSDLPTHLAPDYERSLAHWGEIKKEATRFGGMVTTPFNEMVNGAAKTFDELANVPHKVAPEIFNEESPAFQDAMKTAIAAQPSQQEMAKARPGTQFVGQLLGGLLPYAAAFAAPEAVGGFLPMSTLMQKVGSNILAFGGADAMRAVGKGGGMKEANEAIADAIPTAVLFAVAGSIPTGKASPWLSKAISSVAGGAAFAGSAALQGERDPFKLAVDLGTGIGLNLLHGGKPEEIEAYKKGWSEGKKVSVDQMAKVDEILKEVEKYKPEHPDPESRATINAQAGVLTNPKSTKKTMIVTPGSPMPDDLPKGATTVQTPYGTVVTTDKEAAAVLAQEPTQENIGKYVLNFEGGKDPKATVVVQARDANGLVVGEIAATPEQVPAATEAMKGQSPVDNVTITTPDKALEEREARRAEELPVETGEHGVTIGEAEEVSPAQPSIPESLAANAAWAKEEIARVKAEPGDPVLSHVWGRLEAASLDKQQLRDIREKYGPGIFAKKGKGRAIDQLEQDLERNGNPLRSDVGSDNLASYLIERGEPRRDTIAKGVAAVHAERERMDEMIRKEGPYGGIVTVHGGPEAPQAVKQAIEDTAQILKDAPSQIKGAWDAIKETGQKAWDWYKEPPKFTEFKGLLGRYLGDRQVAGLANQRILKKIAAAVPSKVAREGITNWIQAGGDKSILQSRAEASKGALKRGYEAALKLTPAEETLARGISSQYADHLEEARRSGVLENGLENYVNQLWDRSGQNKKAWAKMRSQINAGMLNTNFKYAMQRVFDSYFEGEQAGFKPLNKDIAYLFGHYHQSMFEAISARKAIKSMFEGKASDGQPLVSVAGGRVIPQEADSPHLLRPKAMYAESVSGERYKPIDHPALRKWKWVENGEEGKPIFMQGDVYVHPEAYKHLKNVLSRSAVQDNVVGRGALALSRDFKSLLLSGMPSGFHQVNLATHALFHKINPMNCPPIDFDQPLQRQLVDHGIMVYNHSALAEFSEGIGTTKGSLAQKIPGMGRLTQKYSEYLFQDLIPRFKMKLGVEAYARNLERYDGKYTNDQILELTANQANAAFGELNYKYIGRNPTHQDIFRLMALAPDFLEARVKFVGQALKPGGREQAAALIRGTLGMYAIGVVGNLLFSDDHEAHWDKPFTMVLNGKDYSLRSIPGDMEHLFKDPRSFAYHRLNPTTTKPLGEFMLGGRDQWGRKRDIWQQGVDYLKGAVPISLQGMVNKKEQTIWDSVLQSLGVTSYKHRTASDQIIGDYFDSHALLNQTQEERAKGEHRRDLVKLGQSGKPDFEAKLKADTNLTDKQKANIRARVKDEKGYLFKQVKDIDVAFEAYQKGTQEEKAVYGPILKKRIMHLLDSDPKKYKKYRDMLKQENQKEQ